MALVGQGGNSYVLIRVEDGQGRLYTWEGGAWHKGEEIPFAAAVRELTGTYTQGTLVLVGVDVNGEVYLGSRKGKMEPLPLRLPPGSSPRLLVGGKGLHLFVTEQGSRRHLPLGDGTFPSPRLVARSGPWMETATAGGDLLLIYREEGGELAYRDWLSESASWTSASRLPVPPGTVEGIGLLHADGQSYLLTQVAKPSETGLYLTVRDGNGWQGWQDIAAARGISRPNLLVQGRTLVVSWQAEGTVWRRWSGDLGRHFSPAQPMVRQDVPLLPLDSAPPEQDVQALAVYGGPPPRLLGHLANWLRPMPEQGNVPPPISAEPSAAEEEGDGRLRRLEETIEDLRQRWDRMETEGPGRASRTMRAPVGYRTGSWQKRLQALTAASEDQRKKLETFEQTAARISGTWEGSRGQLERLIATLLSTSRREEEERKYLILQSRELAKRLDQWEARGTALLEAHSTLRQEWRTLQDRWQEDVARREPPPAAPERGRGEGPEPVPPAPAVTGSHPEEPPQRAQTETVQAPPTPLVELRRTPPTTPPPTEAPEIETTAEPLPQMRGAGLPRHDTPLFQKVRWHGRKS